MATLGLRDIIGPVMVGPSSSHTAGALAIARMARGLCTGTPKRVEFVLYGSFAHTGSGHGTDKALVAGILGLYPDDLAIRDSLDLACDRDLAVTFTFDRETPTEHPNTVDIHIVEAGGAILDVRGESIGGGAAVIRRIDGIDVAITGEHTSIVVRQKDAQGVLAHLASCVTDCGVNIGTARMYRTRRGAAAWTVFETDAAVPPEIKAAMEHHPAVLDVRIILPIELSDASKDGAGASTEAEREALTTPKPADSVTPALSDDPRAPTATAPTRAAADAEAYEVERAERCFAQCDFTSASGLLALCERSSCSIAEAFFAREQALDALNGRSRDTRAYVDHALTVMRDAATRPLKDPVRSMGGLIGGEAQAMAATYDDLETDELGLATAYALAVLETNASMGRIVAAPTAGSAGVVPAVLFALEKTCGYNDDDLRRGLLTAAAVGYLVARNATVSGAEGGCQAEIGTAAAMAAAAAAALAGASPAACLDAAASALTSLMGLVCDPVGGLVEVPCQKRNATAAATALVCARMACAGITNMVGFDETVEALAAVGRMMPFELRESALGGIAATPTACAWCAARE